MAIEKRQLIEELDAAGVKFETIELVKRELGIGAEPDRFAEMPKDGEQYYRVHGGMGVTDIFHRSSIFHREQWERGNCFPTREGAEHSLKAGKYAEDIAWETIKRTAAKYPQPTAEDWKDETVGKCFSVLSPRHGKIVSDITNDCRVSPLPHFLTQSDCEAFAAECEAEIKLVMGVQG